MLAASDRDTVTRLLEEDLLRNVVTLKMMNSHAAAMTFHLCRQADGWAALSLLPAGASDWDRHAYPGARFVALVDGTSVSAALSLLHRLPEGPVVLKTGEPRLHATLDQVPMAKCTAVFRSFTTRPGAPAAALDSSVPEASVLDDDAAALFRGNGYQADELARYFANGARWFGVRSAGVLASACFVFQNYGPVWEVAGVRTLEQFRRKGMGRRIVTAALSHLQRNARLPRYQARADNTASIDLALTCGLVEFLRVQHYFLPEPAVASLRERRPPGRGTY